MTAPPANRRANNFDALRLVAATLVILHHTWAFQILPSVFSHAPVSDLSPGFIGVAIFFIVSGYLIMASWNRRPELLSFMWARTLRIFPGLIVAVLLTIIIAGPLLTSLPLGDYFASPQTRHYLFTVDLIHLDQKLPGVVFRYGVSDNVNTPLWTLPVEFRMYIFVAILGVAGALRNRKLVLILFALAVLGTLRPTGTVFAFLTYWRVTPFISGLLNETNSYPLFFLAGSLLYLFKHQVKVDGHAAVAALLLWLFSHYTHQWLVTSLFCLPYIVMWLAHAKIPHLNRVDRIGDLSYGLYIYAFPIQHIWSERIGLTPYSNGELFALVLLSTLPVAFASWHLVEAPAMKLKEAFGRP